jgi:hypothetical protein
MQNPINYLLSKTKHPPPPLSLFPFGFIPLKNIMHFTRADVEAKVKTIAKSFIVESFCELPPPSTELKINGLYVLLS